MSFSDSKADQAAIFAARLRAGGRLPSQVGAFGPLSGYGFGPEVSEVAGAVTGVDTAYFSGSTMRGIVTGVSVFLITRILDRMLFSERR